MASFYQDDRGKMQAVGWYRPKIDFARLEGIDLTCEVCEKLITRYGRRFCSLACWRESHNHPVSEQLVAVVGELVEQGRYEVDPLEVADSMLYFGGQTDPVRSVRWRKHRLAALETLCYG